MKKKKGKKAPPKSGGTHLRGGGAAGDIRKLKKSLKRRAGQDIRRVPADGITIRFSTEPEEWFEYFEHYDDEREDNYYFPCTEDDYKCEEGDKPTKRFLVNAVDTEEGKQIALVLPQSVASSVLKKYDRFKTVLDRDYFISKEGTGFDTVYDVTPESPSNMNLSKYSDFDLEKLLMSTVDGASDDDDEDDEEEEAPKKKKRVVPKPKKRPSLDDDDDDEDDDEDEDDEDESPRRRKSPTVKRVVKKPLAKSTKSAPRKVMKKRR